MSGEPKIFVDFTIRDPEGRFYVAALHRFQQPPHAGDHFVATDFEEFDEVECEILAIHHERGYVYHRPVDPRAVPGTALPADVGHSSREHQAEFEAEDVQAPVLTSA